MRSARGQFPGAAERPSPDVRVYLFYGADDAGSRSLGTRLLASLQAEKLSFTGASLKADPGALAAEASAISMFGGRNLLWVEPAGDEVLPAVEAVLDAPAADHPVVLIAGALKKTSSLLKFLEAHPLALAHASFVPEGRQLIQLVGELGRERGLRITPPLAAEVATRAANDQAIIGQELTKFALFLNASPEQPAELTEEVLDLLGVGTADTDTNLIADLALVGDLSQLASGLEQLETSGVEAIPTVRALQRRLIMLAGLRSRIEGGQRTEQVLASVWRRDQDVVARILPRWSSQRLAAAMGQVAQLERALLLSPTPGRAALGQELVAMARSVRR